MAEIQSPNGGRSGYDENAPAAIREVLSREPAIDSPGWSAWRQEFSNVIAEEAKRYRIVRFYSRGRRRVISSGLTLSEAREHCHDPETSSSTCTKSAGVRRTKSRGPWFDGYEEQK